jgi:hypothetical protein
MYFYPFFIFKYSTVRENAKSHLQAIFSLADGFEIIAIVLQNTSRETLHIVSP